MSVTSRLATTNPIAKKRALIYRFDFGKCRPPVVWPAIVILLGFVNSSSAQVLNSGNGHYYQRINVPGGLDWFSAQSAAASTTFNGADGYLATVTTQEENDFLLTSFNASFEWLGGFQPPGSVEPAGGWQWVTGEPWNYTNWATGEPSNSTGGVPEDGLQFFFGPSWNDLPRTYLNDAYIVEFSPVPEPTALALCAMLLIGCGAVRVRRRITVSSQAEESSNRHYRSRSRSYLSRIRSFALLTCTAWIASYGAQSAIAIDKTWSAGGNGLWTTNSNWNPTGEPNGAQFLVSITDASSTVTLDASRTIGGLTLRNGNQLTIPVMASLDIADENPLDNLLPTIVNDGILLVNGGRLKAIPANIDTTGAGQLQVFSGGVISASTIYLRGLSSALVSGKDSYLEVNHISFLPFSLPTPLLRIEGGGRVLTHSFLAIQGVLDIAAGGSAVVEVTEGVSYIAGGQAVVHGKDARWELAQQLQVGRDGAGRLTIIDGGAIVSKRSTSPTGTSGAIGVRNGSASALAVVSGRGSIWQQDGALAVGFGTGGNGVLQISSGGLVESDSGSVGANSGTNGQGVIDNATWHATNQIVVGTEGVGEIVLQNGGLLSAGGGLTIGPQGKLSGNGVVSTNAFLNGGVVSPGSSPGLLTIDGNFQQGASGRLLMELAGTTAGSYDQLHVFGNLIVEGTIEVKLLGGFQPHVGDVFKLFTVGGLLDYSKASFSLPMGLRFDSVMPGEFRVAAVPEPGSVLLVVCPLAVYVLSNRRAGRAVANRSSRLSHS